MGSTDKAVRSAQVATVFTPASPIDKLALLAGRTEILMDVVNAILPRGQHVVLYGERGVGKTSLTNVLSEVLGRIEDSTPFRKARINCNTTDDFESIWIKVFRELDLTVPTGTQIEPEEVRYQLGQLGNEMSLVILDELDRLEDDEALSLLADTVKTLSDNGSSTTLVLVGVADSVTELVGDHLSVERALIQIPMPRMSNRELQEILDKGMAVLGTSIDDRPKQRIARLSEGLPHYTHLLSLYATQRSVMDDRTVVTMEDVDGAIRMAINKAQQTIQTAYLDATRSPRTDNRFKEVLLACALAPKDPLGYFTGAGVRRPLSMITGRPYEISGFTRHLGEFMKPHRGPALIQIGESHRHFYRFANPLLQPFTILSGVANGLISEDQVSELQDAEAGDLWPPSAPGQLFDLPPTAPQP